MPCAYPLFNEKDALTPAFYSAASTRSRLKIMHRFSRSLEINFFICIKLSTKERLQPYTAQQHINNRVFSIVKGKKNFSRYAVYTNNPPSKGTCSEADSHKLRSLRRNSPRMNTGLCLAVLYTASLSSSCLLLRWFILRPGSGESTSKSAGRAVTASKNRPLRRVRPTTPLICY